MSVDYVRHRAALVDRCGIYVHTPLNNHQNIYLTLKVFVIDIQFLACDEYTVKGASPHWRTTHAPCTSGEP